MNNYYCPYCSPKHQIHTEDKFGNLICGYCGDLLIKEGGFKFNRMISFIAIFAIIAPLLLLIASLINNHNQDIPNQEKYSLTMESVIRNNLIIKT